MSSISNSKDENCEIKLYRKRFIPSETIYLKDDIILECNEEIIITKWNTIKPRKDFSHGLSCYYIKEGYKVSLFYDKDNNLVYTYCDIITVEHIKEENKIICTDLLVDVIIYPDGFVKVVDIAELAECIDDNIITVEILKESLLKTDNLLKIIYDNKLDILTKALLPYINA